MGFFFAKNTPDKCCLCGSSEQLTGEHKLKRTGIAKEFGTDKMAIGTTGATVDSNLHFAQSPKSKAFHFRSKLCADCNGSRTQDPDKQFDELHTATLRVVKDGGDPSTALKSADYSVDTQRFHDTARYFAKLICCHIAEINAPRPIYISRFAIGSFTQNRMWLSARTDPTYEQISNQGIDLPYAAHSGLIVYGDKDTGAPTGFHSTITFGPVQYVFYFHLDWKELIELRLCHQKFYAWSCEQVKRAKASPLSESERNQLGR